MGICFKGSATLKYISINFIKIRKNQF